MGNSHVVLTLLLSARFKVGLSLWISTFFPSSRLTKLTNSYYMIVMKIKMLCSVVHSLNIFGACRSSMYKVHSAAFSISVSVGDKKINMNVALEE